YPVAVLPRVRLRRGEEGPRRSEMRPGSDLLRRLQVREEVAGAQPQPGKTCGSWKNRSRSAPETREPQNKPAKPVPAARQRGADAERSRLASGLRAQKYRGAV